MELIGEIFISGFVGLLVFMGMVGMDFPVGVSAAASGVGGHMATRLLYAAEEWLERYVTGAPAPSTQATEK